MSSNLNDWFDAIIKGLNLTKEQFNEGLLRMAQRAEERVTNCEKDIERDKAMLNRPSCTPSRRTKLLRNLSKHERDLQSARSHMRDIMGRLQTEVTQQLEKGRTNEAAT